MKLFEMTEEQYDEWCNNRDLDFELVKQDVPDISMAYFLKKNKKTVPEERDILILSSSNVAFQNAIDQELSSGFDREEYPGREQCKTSCAGWNGSDETCECGRNKLCWKPLTGCSFLDMLVVPVNEEDEKE